MPPCGIEDPGIDVELVKSSICLEPVAKGTNGAVMS